MRIFVILFLSIFLASCAYQVHTYDKEISPVEDSARIEEPNKSLQVGEKLVYAVDWIGIPAGFITLEVKETMQINNHLAYHIIAKARPNRFFKIFYDIEYTVHTYIDTKTLKPIRFHKERSLNRKITDETIEFSYDTDNAIWEYSNPKTRKELSIPKNAQDLLSSLYYFRLIKIGLGKHYPISIIYGGESWSVDIMAERIADIQITNRGHFKTMVIAPVSDLAKHITGFKNFKAFLTTDKRRLPVLFTMRTKIGYLSGILISDSLCKNSN